jgi:hypothetical protein
MAPGAREPETRNRAEITGMPAERSQHAGDGKAPRLVRRSDQTSTGRAS